MESVLPRKAKWIKDAVAKFNPNSNEVITSGGHSITYDFLVIAIGLQLNYSKVSARQNKECATRCNEFFSLISTDSRLGGSTFNSKRKCDIDLLAKICGPTFECAKTFSRWKYHFYISCIASEMSVSATSTHTSIACETFNPYEKQILFHFQRCSTENLLYH